MEFEFPEYKRFTHHFKKIANRFSLDPDQLKIEFYRPHSQAILIESVDDQDFKIHINLQEDRIVSIKNLSSDGSGFSERLREKYRKHMK